MDMGTAESTSTPADSAKAAVAPVADPVAAASKAEPAAPRWFDGFSDEEKAFLSSKGWDKEDKGPGDVLKSYRNLERLRGVDADKLMRVPDWSKPEEVAQYRARLGVPEAANGYKNHEVEIPTGVLNAEKIAEISHKAHLSQAQHEIVLNATGELMRELFEAEGQDLARKNALAMEALKKEYGPSFSALEQSSKSAVAQLGISDEEQEALKISMGSDGALKFLGRIGKALAEPQRPNNSNQAPFMTSAVAKERIAMLMKDRAWMDAHANGDAEKRREWNELQRIAYPG